MGDRILDCITAPSDLGLLTNEELGILATEVREQIVRDTSRTGGHVASSLGAVEIILAVHSLIKSPHDRFVFDVGHQAYAHKLLTGRMSRFHTLRTFQGLSGFTNPFESEHDVHASGHASDSLSIALGLAKARAIRGGDEKIVALIGDAGLSGGMAFEAINTIGQMQLPIVMILNDNEMSISRNVGALVKHLGALRSSEAYREARDATQERFEQAGRMPRALVGFGRSMKDSLKQFVLPQETMLYEQLGILCTPPIDGHDIAQLKDILATALEADGPVLIHAVTRKGAGYAPAEADPVRFHGAPAFDVATGKDAKPSSGAPSYTSVFGNALVAEGEADDRVVAITAAMRGGTGVEGFFRAFPDRAIDVGIAEENAVGMAAGLSKGGMKPVVAIYSTFLQRAIDQLIIDNALIETNVVFAIDRAGLVGADGATHHGVFDLVYTRMVPNMRVLAPSNEAELVNALHTALQLGGPVAVRYPRGNAQGVELPKQPACLPLGRSVERRAGDQVVFLAFGDMVKVAMDAAELMAQQGIEARVVDMRWAKPLDEDAIARAADAELVVTLEDGAIAGGVGEGVVHALTRTGKVPPVMVLGIEDAFVTHGAPAQLFESLGLDAPQVASRVQGKLQQLRDQG
ncbi:1-deoxy-D-xylulose-5-phosphate synthase [Eggerthellaceae bacterium zg-1084]|uniref:1-deoxy-D-xylulose-5-phosphate synthase n=1 Tax=Berryella wangjianweii TaxID=2734634 RepID=UPI0015548ED4|nr:1-deoxy-D-xylulose-5-phosphate synthase [Berryella wangjianweii]NPD30840.1 1-deoxy-D-xylulose-5-phosphate synthase [Berryella wangjianweii]NPD31707.1 1-deoxy-D-xylulose-5-phosphate synthase [Eggerthellaceae bacterium zg-997]